MTRNGAQCVVGYSGRHGETCESGELEERGQEAVGREVEIEVDTAVVVEEEVAEGISALYGVRVGGVGGEEGGVVG